MRKPRYRWVASQNAWLLSLPWAELPNRAREHYWLFGPLLMMLPAAGG